jgi:hypothetical protein
MSKLKSALLALTGKGIDYLSQKLVSAVSALLRLKK